MKSIVEQIVLHEGKRNKPYRCTAGKLTIGVGRNLDDVGLSDDEIEYLLMNDLKRVQAELNKAIPWWEGLTPVRQKVLLDMGFNLGVPGLLGFKNTLALIKAGDYKQAAVNMLMSKWAKQVGTRAVRLAKMMETGEDYAPS